MNTPPSGITINEGRLILIIGLIQFVNILDFMMVMPLGPDFAHALGIPADQIGLIGGAYTFSAAVTGLLAALYLDQIARKRAMLFCLVGLTLATFSGALAWNRESMLAARLLAGMFGGPLTSLAQAFIADYIPVERRGRAMGKVAGAFAAASVLGVPFGLELASRLSWHAPFNVTGALAAIVMLLACRMLPYHAPYISELPLRVRAKRLLAMLSLSVPLMSYGFMLLTMMAGFMIIPNIAAHLQMNLHYPREQMGLLYFCGGVVSFFGMRLSGWMTDKTSSLATLSMFTVALALALGTGFIWFHNSLPILAIFIVFMVSMTGRIVAVQALCSKIPSAGERGAYMSVQSAVTHIGSASGAYYSSLLLTTQHGKLLHVPMLGATALALSLFVPLLVWRVERRVARRTREAS